MALPAIALAIARGAAAAFQAARAAVPAITRAAVASGRAAGASRGGFAQRAFRVAREAGRRGRDILKQPPKGHGFTKTVGSYSRAKNAVKQLAAKAVRSRAAQAAGGGAGAGPPGSGGSGGSGRNGGGSGGGSGGSGSPGGPGGWPSPSSQPPPSNPSGGNPNLADAASRQLFGNTLTDLRKQFEELTIGGAIKRVARFPDELQKFGDALVQARRHLAEFSGSTSYSYARLDAERYFRTSRMALQTSGSTAALTRAQSRLEDALMPSMVVLTNFVNRLVAAVENRVAGALEILNQTVSMILEMLRVHFPGTAKQLEDALAEKNKIDSSIFELMIRRGSRGDFGPRSRPPIRP